MKTIKNSFFKIFYGPALLALLVLTACKDRNEPTPEAVIAGTTVKSPEVDINTAVITDNMSALRQHIANRSDLDEKDPVTGSSPLINAAILGRTEMAKALIDGGANLNFQNNEGITALIGASFFCHPEIVRLLLYSHADKTIKDRDGQTAYESVHAPFENVRNDYDKWVKKLEPLALKLDYAYLEKTRPVMESMLKYD